MARDEAYRKAEKKIEEARRSGATELNLSVEWDENSLKLTELPESLGHLTQLRELDLSNNQLTVLPKLLSRLTELRSLALSGNQLTALPEWLGHLTQLQSLELSALNLTKLPMWLKQLACLRSLNLSVNSFSEFPDVLRTLVALEEIYIFNNRLISVPFWIWELKALQILKLSNNSLRSLPAVNAPIVGLTEFTIDHNPLVELPDCIRQFTHLKEFWAVRCNLNSVPEWLGELRQLRNIHLWENNLTDLPSSLAQLEHLEMLRLDKNPLNPELAAAHKEGFNAVMRYLRAKAETQIVLNEAKLILVGEGEVGKSCLLGALRGDEWEEGRPTTHGIEIKPVKVNDPDNGTEITLNGWDFGGQRVYRPTHQLFFSAPAVYLVVWKPREGPEQGFVKDWIRLVKHREPEAKIFVVATHGGPGQRQPDISPQEYWELFGRDTLINFFHVESKPDEQTGERRGIAGLKDAIARVAASLPEMGRTVPARWQQAREALKQTGAPYLPLEQVLEICREHQMDEEEARLFVTISHRLGHLIYYEHDPVLQDIVILKPDWLATAISFVLDDKQTRDAHGLVSSARLSQLWDDPQRAEEFRYPPKLHPVFLRLMERFDLSYRVAGLVGEGQPDATTSLIAQLVPDIRPDPIPGWDASAAESDGQQVQICRIVEFGSGQSATAEGLFYQLIVRLHKFSLGRVNYRESAHWQRGLVLDDDYNGRALMEHAGNDVRITVRAPYPEGFLSVLTHEVKWLVESFWAGLRCDVMVPCLVPRPDREACAGLFEVRKLIENKRRNRPEQPCPVCNEWQNIDQLLRNAPAAQRIPAEQLLAGVAEMKGELSGVRELLIAQHREEIGRFDEGLGRFDKLDVGVQRILSQADDAFTRLMQALTDEAKDGPRLFSFQPADPGLLKKWTSRKFQLTLWCEHSRLPLPALNGDKDGRGVYDLSLPREWFVKAAPFFKVLSTTLSLVLPVASSATKLLMDETAYRSIEKELDLGQKSVESVLKGGEQLGGWLGSSDAPELEHGDAIRAQGAILRELHALLKKQDPSFGGLVRVQNKRQEFLWVHPQFEKEY